MMEQRISSILNQYLLDFCESNRALKTISDTPSIICPKEREKAEEKLHLRIQVCKYAPYLSS